MVRVFIGGHNGAKKAGNAFSKRTIQQLIWILIWDVFVRKGRCCKNAAIKLRRLMCLFPQKHTLDHIFNAANSTTQ